MAEPPCSDRHRTTKSRRRNARIRHQKRVDEYAVRERARLAGMDIAAALRAHKAFRGEMFRDLQTGPYAKRCWYCGIRYSGTPNSPRGRTQDHKEPIGRDGLNCPSNIVLCCRRCNGWKADHTVDEFRAIVAGGCEPIVFYGEATNRTLWRPVPALFHAPPARKSPARVPVPGAPPTARDSA